MKNLKIFSPITEKEILELRKQVCLDCDMVNKCRRLEFSPYSDNVINPLVLYEIRKKGKCPDWHGNPYKHDEGRVS